MKTKKYSELIDVLATQRPASNRYVHISDIHILMITNRT